LSLADASGQADTMRKVYEQLLETGHSHDEAVKVIAEKFDLSIESVISSIGERKPEGAAAAATGDLTALSETGAGRPNHGSTELTNPATEKADTANR
jgi:hypothetical protein